MAISIAELPEIEMKNAMFCFSLTVPLVLSMVGCAASYQPSTPDAKTGWVTEFYSEQSLGPKVPSCLTRVSREQILSGKYVEVKVPHLRSSRYVSAEVPAGMKLTLGDKVEVSPANCKDGKIPIVIQVLSAKPATSVK
ncbi:hypothetical protein LPN04_28995 [Rugamonas sp. A1-17]|nr:hypothetical protein [Rugamonas sp. A1-17]